MKINGWIIYIYAKILPNFRVGIQANSSAFDIFPQKQSLLKKEIVTKMYLFSGLFIYTQRFFHTFLWVSKQTVVYFSSKTKFPRK